MKKLLFVFFTLVLFGCEKYDPVHRLKIQQSLINNKKLTNYGEHQKMHDIYFNKDIDTLGNADYIHAKVHFKVFYKHQIKDLEELLQKSENDSVNKIAKHLLDSLKAERKKFIDFRK